MAKKHINDLEFNKFHSNTAVKTIDYRRGNSVDVKKTTVGASVAKKIDMPEKAEEIILVFRTSSSTLWIGKSAALTLASTDIFPILKDEKIVLNLKKGNNNNLYGISSSGDIDVYAMGIVNE
jgi:hypothetical protein